MKQKVSKIVLWIISIIFLLCSISGFANKEVISALSFLFAALFVNPIISSIMESKLKFKSKIWMKLTAILVCFILVGIFTDTTTSNSSLLSSNTNSPAVESTTLSESVSLTPQISTPPESTESLIPSITPTQTEENTGVNKDLTVNFLDVGQGDSIFIVLPTGETMLIDAGNDENGSDIVDYIATKGYNFITYLIATHPHADHIGGMAYVVNNLTVKNVYMPKVQTDTETFENLLTAIQNKGLKVNSAKAGVSVFESGDIKISFIAPNSDNYDDLNDYSAVIKLTYKANSFLFMGDAETVSENEITADVNADVIKTGHHGSDSSTGQTFLNKVSPKYAVISVGADNSYGHPTQETLDKLNDNGITTFRTDLDGTIVFTSDGDNITIDKSPSPYESNAPPTVAQATASATTATIQPTATPTVSNEDVTVYITETGSKYHSDGCRYLSKSKIAMSLSDAISAGYEPCSVCNPPTLTSNELSSAANAQIKATVQPTATPQITKEDTQEVTVYITKTGRKYHRSGCRYLKKSCIAISLDDAKSEGYGACSVCDPPT